MLQLVVFARRVENHGDESGGGCEGGIWKVSYTGTVRNLGFQLMKLVANSVGLKKELTFEDWVELIGQVRLKVEAQLGADGLHEPYE